VYISRDSFKEEVTIDEAIIGTTLEEQWWDIEATI
jgi:hypothetical protein